MSSKYHKLIKPGKSLAGLYTVTCSAALVSSIILLRLNHARPPQFYYLLPLAMMLIWSLYYVMTGKSAALEFFERIDNSSPLSTPAARLLLLRELREAGRLSEAEYQQQRHYILERLSTYP